MATPAWPYRYELLDGLRGAAALYVVLFHLYIVPGGQFAVMVFFVISGYCITASAESCRERGIRFTEFMQRRLRRIYPPYLIALIFFVVTRAVKMARGGADDLARAPVEWLQNVTLTQWLSLMTHPQHLASENPTLFVAAFWSLNYEEQFYLVMALCLLLAARQRIPMIVPVVVLAIAGLAFNAMRPGNWVCGLFIEYWAHFALGSTLFFVLCKYTAHRVRVVYALVLVLLGGTLAMKLLPWDPVRIGSQRAWVELTLLVGVTLCLLVLRRYSAAVARSLLWQPVAALGTISYSLYLIHQFNLTLVSSVASWLLPAAPRPLYEVAVVSLHIVLATCFWYCFERPFIRRGMASHPDHSRSATIETYAK